MSPKNPKRTGGPKTSEGKLIASQNSVKTAAYSSLPVLPNESSEEFNQLLNQFNYDFLPKSVVESILVRELAVITWKKLRLERLEQDYFIKRINAPIKINEFIECGLDFDEARYECWLNRSALVYEDAKALEGLIDLIKPNIGSGLSVEQLIEFKLTYEPIYISIEKAYRQLEPLATQSISILDIVNKTVCNPGKPDRYLSSVVIESLVKDFEATLWCAKRSQEIADAVAYIKQERLFLLMQSEVVNRAGEDLSRAMSRTLNELRKQNSWRISNSLIDTSGGA